MAVFPAQFPDRSRRAEEIFPLGKVKTCFRTNPVHLSSSWETAQGSGVETLQPSCAEKWNLYCIFTAFDNSMLLLRPKFLKNLKLQTNNFSVA